VAGDPEEFALHVAAEAFGVDKRTLTRDVKHDRFPNAYRTKMGWIIPRADLEAVGYRIDPRYARRLAAILRNSERIARAKAD
jgi:hypothetical protein